MKQTSLFDDAGAPTPASRSAFAEFGFRATVDALVHEIRALYLADKVPWVVGYSGGKDSTATLQFVWLALRGIPREQRHKPVHVISTDTQVENPIVAQWAAGSLHAMRAAVAAEQLWLGRETVLCVDCARPQAHPDHDTFGNCTFRLRPAIEVHRLTPALPDSFWVLLIGKGYPAPRRMFRWCTDRLKIRPSTAFIQRVIQGHGEAILVLGTRKAESAERRARMERLETARIRERLSPNASQPGSLVYSPIENWSNDDVWLFLMQERNPWGWSNKTLLTLYQGATEGGECPLVVDTSTPSCGASRFGCWVCTLVEQDKSMTAMVQNDADKEWMLPLLELRNALDFRQGDDGDRHLRDYRRMDGRVQLMMTNDGPRPIPGPYLQSARADWLRRLLLAERWIREHGPDEVRAIELISMAELHEIRRIWVQEKNEIEDLLPRIFEETRGEPFPTRLLHQLGLGVEDLAVLRELCGDEHTYQLARDLLAVEHRYRQTARRAGLFGALDNVLQRHMYSTEQEAVAVQRSAIEGQLNIMSGAEQSVPGETPEEKQARVTKQLERIVAAGGLLGDLARQVVNDVQSLPQREKTKKKGRERAA